MTSASGSDTFTNTYQPAATGLALSAQKSYVKKKDDNTPIRPQRTASSPSMIVRGQNDC